MKKDTDEELLELQLKHLRQQELTKKIQGLVAIGLIVLIALSIII